MEAIRILHVDGDAMFRELLESQFNSGVNSEENNGAIRIEASVALGKEALSVYQEGAFDLVVLEIELPDISGYRVVEELLDRNPDQRILILSSLSTLNNIGRGITIGVDGYLSKQNPVAKLRQVITVIHSGTQMFEGNSGAVLLRENRKKGNGNLLTEKEAKLLKYIHADKTRMEIARLLQVSGRTVDSYLQLLREKLGLRTNIGLAIYAEKYHLF